MVCNPSQYVWVVEHPMGVSVHHIAEYANALKVEVFVAIGNAEVWHGKFTLCVLESLEINEGVIQGCKSWHELVNVAWPWQ